MKKRPPAKSTSRQQRRSDHTRARLLDAATELFIAHGYDALTLGEVTERADLGTGTLYLHFRDKRALYEGIVRRVLAGLYERWQRTDDASADPSERVVGMIRAMIEQLIERPALGRLCLLDGPPVETWLVGDIAKGMALFLEGPQRELRASLIIGVALAAGRHYLRSDHQPKARQLLETTLAFCSGALDSAQPTAARTRRVA